MPRISPKTGLFNFCQKINPFMFLFFTQKWLLKEFFVILQKAHFRKNLVLKCFQPITLQYFLIIKISKKNQVIFHGVGLQAKAASEKVAVWFDVTRFAFHVIRLHDSLVINILGENHLIT